MDNEFQEFLKRSVDKIAPDLSGMSADELAKLRAAEEAGQKRSTLFKEIDDAIADREKAATQAASDAGDQSRELEHVEREADKARATAPAPGGAGVQQGQIDPTHSRGEAIYSQADLDERLAEQAAAHADEIALLTNASKERASLVNNLLSDEGAITDLSRGSPLMLGSGELIVMLVDDIGQEIDGLSPLTFAQGNFKRIGNRVILNKDIELPPSLAATQIAAAKLIDDEDDVIAKATLVQPFQVGGGRSAKLPAGTLTFMR